jgi:hypothetical protein
MDIIDKENADYRIFADRKTIYSIKIKSINE